MTDQPITGSSARATPRGRTTRAVTAGCALLLAPYAAWTLARYLGLDSAYPLAQLVAFTPYIALTAPIPVLVAAVARRWWLATGYRDAASTVGAGLVPTWPYAGARARVTPRVTLDHAFADERVAVTGYEVFTTAGTDHRPILAELVVPAGANR